MRAPIRSLRDAAIGAGRRATLRGASAALGPQHRRFFRALRVPHRAQEAVLRDLAARLARCEYGSHLGVSSARDFDRRAPVVDYATFRPWLDRQRETEDAVVTPDPVLFYEPTSGSSGTRKLIPYTAALRRTFTDMFAVWAHDLLNGGPGLSTGTFYMSISPRLGAAERTERGLPIGTSDDRDYLGGFLRPLVSAFVVAPGDAPRDAESFWRATCRALVARADLEAISVWSPSFLQCALDWIDAHAAELRDASGTRRAALQSGAVDWRALWPQLKLVSMWASAGAAPLARAVADRLPDGVAIQPKGLLATEAPISVPLWERPGAAPAVDTTLIELLDDRGNLLPLWRARVGERYEVVVSTVGGLTRYRIGDRVEVVGRVFETPLLDFVGRSGGTCDLVGEKLSEEIAAEALGQLDTGGAFHAILAPAAGERPHYVLLLDASRRAAADLCSDLDRLLMRAHHYRLARELGQLDGPRLLVCPALGELIREQDRARSISIGDAKPRALASGAAAVALIEGACAAAEGMCA